MEWRIAAAAVTLLLTGLIGLSSTSTSTTGRPTTTPMGEGGPLLPNGTYLIMYPKSIRVGHSFHLTVQVFDLVKDFVVKASLAKSSRKAMLASEEITFRAGTSDSGTIELEVPEFTDATCMLSVTGSSRDLFGEYVHGLSFEEEKSIKLDVKGMSVFIQTDKAIYKPSQKVQFRAMAVYPDLKPYNGSMDIKIFDAEGNQIRQYLDVENPGHNGVISKDLQLSDQPVLGDWKIEVKAMENTKTKVFTVSEYVLPKFEVTVDAPSYFYYLDSVLTITVDAKYTYGKKVKGTADIAVQLSYESYEKGERTPPQHKITVSDFVGSTTLRLTRDDLLRLVLPPNADNPYTIDPVDVMKRKKILVTANVTEGVSDVTLSGAATVPVETQRYELKYLSASPSSFKPGLNYNGFLKLSQVDGSPPLASDLLTSDGDAETLQIVFTGQIGTQWPYKQKRLNETFDIQSSGLVRFSIRIPDDFDKITISATFKFITASKDIQKFKSKSDVGMQVSLVGLENGGAIKPDSEAIFRVDSTESIDAFNIVILSKGMLVISRFHQVMARSTENRVMIVFNATIAQKLSPSARVVVWYITDSNEVITDSLDFNVEGVFTNEVSLSFDKNETRPGDSLNLEVTADAGSYVGLLAIDQSVLLLKGGNDITQTDVIEELKTYGSSDSSSSGDPEPMPLMRCLFCGWPVFSGGSDSSEVFNSAGVQVITNALVHKDVPTSPVFNDGDPMFIDGNEGPRVEDAEKELGVPEPDESPVESGLESAERVRTEFPETWLWSDTTTGSDGKAVVEVTAPDTITSWIASAFAVSHYSGLGIAPTASKLNVFQPFFVSLNLPYSVIRQEEFGLQAMIFNYLNEVVEVKVTLKRSDSFAVRSQNDIENAVHKEDTLWVTVPPNEAKSAWFWVVPKMLGNMPIEVKAQSHLAADAVRRNLLVEPEGAPQEYSKSIIVDFSEGRGSLTETVDITLPPDLVEGSQYIKVTAIGDLMGTSIQGLGSLLAMPYGCGEQNMINFAPAIYIMNYLKANNLLTQEVKTKALKIMETGYMKELTYQHTDGSFSAFGNSDPSGSMWLSAFVAKSFHEAESYIYIDSNLVAKTLEWIIAGQGPDGSFAEPKGGRVIHTDMQGGSSKGVPLTAYVLAALVENSDVSGPLKTRIDNAIASAMANLEVALAADDLDPYALAIVTYALLVSNSGDAETALYKLKSAAVNSGGMTHWEVGKKDALEPVDAWKRPYHQAGASDIEITAYALLSYNVKNDLIGGISIVKWLASQRNPNGGFSSTQDTVLALQAMAEMKPKGDSLNLAISLDIGHIGYDYDDITETNAGILQSRQLPTDTQAVVISAAGTGLAVVQVSVSYNVIKADNAAGVVVDIRTEDQNDGVTKITACGRYTKTNASGMTVMEVGLITGNEAEVSESSVKQSTLKRVEKKDRKVVLYFDEFTENETCVEIISKQVVPLSHAQEARVDAYQYYSPDVKDTKYYLPEALAQVDICTSCRECCGYDPDIIPWEQSGGSTYVANLVLVLAAIVTYFAVL